MTHLETAYHLFRMFLGRNPDEKEQNDLAAYGVGTDGYLLLDPRIWQKEKPIFLFYTSCHADQFISYLRQYRREVIDSHYILVLFTHRLLLWRGFFNLDFIHAIFGAADLVFTNPMNPKFEELSTIPLLPKCKPTAKIVTFVPPSVASFWPVVDHFGEEPIAKMMIDGLTADQACERFLTGKLDCLFEYRHRSQMDRLIRREQDCDVSLSPFIEAHLKTHKMFFTSNHPTFHVATHLMEEGLRRLGFPPKHDSWPLEVPTNGAGFSNHHPETFYEWNHFGFGYPRRWSNEYGGPQNFYPAIIRRGYEKIKDPEKVLNTPVIQVELEP